MQKSLMADSRMSILLSLFVLALVAALIFLPNQFQSAAVGQKDKKGLLVRTESHDPEIPNYDIREEKSDRRVEFFEKARGSVGKNAVAVADVREGFVQGEEALRARLPQVKFEYNSDIRIPEVITPDVWKSEIEYLSAPTREKRSEVLRNFVKENNSLIGVDDQQADSLKVAADYTNPDGNLSYAHLEQLINGVPVFRGEVKAGFTKDGRIIRVINNLAPGLDYGSLSGDFRDPLDAVKAAAGHIKYEMKPSDSARNDAVSNDLKTVFGTGDWATTAEKMYFPTEPGVAVPAWRVLIWLPVNAYYVIVDAETGTMLWRKNITEDQTQSATYQVYRNSPAYIDVADSPAPLSPGPIDPTTGAQGALITRGNVTLIGNEGTNSFNNNGWITDGANSTDGNSNEAGIDRVTPTGVDAPMPGDGPCPGAGCRVFSSTWNPPPGSPAPGDDPLTAQAQRGAVIQMFYVMNRYHDELYKRGFTEAARNFQGTNFTGMGLGNDRVSSEGQDSAGFNNANFGTPADGGRGVMQMFLWNGPTPDYDGTTDAEVIIHEVTHGTSNRLHGNASGLSTNMARGMGEGWSDFYSYAMLAEPTDPINGIYTTGGYATLLIATGFTGNYYYGIRRFPRAPITFLGTNGRPHNPFTFQYINSNCNTLIGTTTSGPNSAFPRGPIGAAQCDQVHNIGEIWSSMLWEVRNRMVTRLGFAAGTTRALQVVTDGMKLAPIGPTLIQERDAIMAAAAALPLAPEAVDDVTDVREGFRVRGMGFSASIQSASPAAVTEAFDIPNALITNPMSVSDSTGDNDGFPEPGENVLVTVPITNTLGSTVANVNGSITGGGTASYGDIANGATVNRQIAYTVPSAAACGSLHTVTITGTSSLGALDPRTFSFQLGSPVGGAPVTFSNTTAITINDNGPATPYPSNITVSGLTGNKVIRLTLNGFSHTFPADVDMLLVGPGGQKFVPMSDSGGTATVSGVNIALTDAAAAAIPAPVTTGVWRPTNSDTTTDVFPVPAPASPYDNPAPAGTATFGSSFGSNGTTMNGTWSLYVRDDAGVDIGSIAGGWSLTFEANDFACAIAAKSRADFDGDGRTDLSIFRPSTGDWWLNRSTAGLTAFQWGVTGDVIVPGDYDGDGKADTAVFRPDVNASNPDFFILNSNGFTVSWVSWGLPGDIPNVRDFDGDAKDDPAVFRPSTGVWYVLKSAGGITVEPFGLTGDIPVAGDYDGDGNANLAVFRPSENTWYIARATGIPATNFDAVPFGLAGDVLVPANYDTDARDDIAVWRPSNGTWYILQSATGTVAFVPFGTSGDVPVPGDYDGDGRDDQAVYRGGMWFLNRSTSGFAAQGFGLGTDTAVPAEYIP